ncbi:hypothetical protein [Streptomyces anulatus]|uniref:hypothetical protein n=1 Tax=Streptomyces anulatus TaxID=1892 RepID=UPI00331AE7BB
MIHITLGARRYVNAQEDQLGRSIVGFDPVMNDDALFHANRGCWVLGERAEKERYVLLSHEGEVRMAIEIDSLVPVAGGRKAIEGRYLTSGHEVYDAYVGKPTPVETIRNPITYFDSPLGARACYCGCGESVASGWFVIGHDQRALHARISKIGTVREFIDWFDSTYVEATGE